MGPVPGERYGYSEGELATPYHAWCSAMKETGPRLLINSCAGEHARLPQEEESGNGDKPKERPGLTGNGEERQPVREVQWPVAASLEQCGVRLGRAADTTPQRLSYIQKDAVNSASPRQLVSRIPQVRRRRRNRKW